MAYKSRIESLKQRHNRLDQRIFDEDHRPLPDQQIITGLKLEKLKLKEEIERLQGVN